MLSESQAKELVTRVLARARAEETTVSLGGGRTTHLRFARNTPSTSGTSSGVTMQIESAFGKRAASVTLNQFDDATIEAAVRRSEELARIAPEDPERMPVLGAQSYVKDARPKEIDHEALPGGVATCIADAKREGVVAAGFTQAEASFSCFATSKGLFAYSQDSRCFFAETARTSDGSGSGWAAQIGRSVGEVQFGGVSRTAIAKAKASRNPQPLKPGKYVTILEPACVASLVQGLVWRMDAREADEGRSYFSDKNGNRLGQKLFPNNIQIWSDPADARAPGGIWGEGGVPQVARHWVKNGRIENLRTSRYWAQKTNRAPVPSPSNLLMEGGRGTLDDLVASTERGFWSPASGTSGMSIRAPCF